MAIDSEDSAELLHLELSLTEIESSWHQFDSGCGRAVSKARWLGDTNPDRVHTGVGLSDSAGLAVMTSQHELVKKICFSYWFETLKPEARDVSWRSRSGFAVSADLAQSQLAAALELAECDLFIRSWLTRSPTQRFQSPWCESVSSQFQIWIGQLGSIALCAQGEEMGQAHAWLGAVEVRKGVWALVTQSEMSVQRGAEKLRLKLEHMIDRLASSGEVIPSSDSWFVADRDRGDRSSDSRSAEVSFQTTRVDAGLGYSLFITRAMSPDLAPIWFGRRQAPEGLVGIYEALGLGTRQSLNLSPHPLLEE